MKKKNDNHRQLDHFLQEAPEGCGVYLLMDSKKRVIYVGKSKSIRKRLADHLRAAASGDPKERLIVQDLAEASYVLTKNELEALILENNLIKRHGPRFNVYFRDDKEYPYLRLNREEKYPRLTVVRRPTKDGALYFGPYVQAKAMRQTIRFVGRIFLLRQCDDIEFARRTRPCLNYEMGRCPGPCCGRISRREYRDTVRQLIIFLQGRRSDLVKSLKDRMMEASEFERYEEAAILRDRMTEMVTFAEKQAIYQTKITSADVIGLARRQTEWVFFVFFVRHGKVVAGEPVELKFQEDLKKEEGLKIFLERFYATKEDIPNRVIVSALPDQKELLEEYLTMKAGRKVRIDAPSRGPGLEILLRARKNALSALERKSARLIREIPEPESPPPLQEKIGSPRRIEIYDASSTRGDEAVATVVVWEYGLFQRRQYRRFRMKRRPGMNDYAMIREAVSRRLMRITAGEFPPPDMILVDGGSGHVSTIVDELEKADLPGVVVLGISKGEKRRGGDRLHLPGGQVHLLPQNSPFLLFLARLRDEAHRFTLSYHRQRRGKEVRRSVLDDIKGVGPRRKAILLEYFGDIEGIASAELDDLMAVPGIPAGVAREVSQNFRSLF